MTFDGTEPMRILAIGAHPDDIEAGCGGALVKYAQNGHRVFLMVMTEGEQGGAGELQSQLLVGQQLERSGEAPVPPS